MNPKPIIAVGSGSGVVPGRRIGASRGIANAGSRLMNLVGASPPSSLVALTNAAWQLVEASGTRVDSSPNAQVMTPNGTPGNGTGLVYSKALALVAASSQYLNRANNAILTRVGSLTYAAWVNPASPQFYPMVFSSDGPNWELRMLAGSRQPEFAGQNGSNAVATYGTAISLNNWHLLIGWWDFDLQTINIQVDNDTPVSAPSVGTPIAFGGDFNIGSRTGGALFWDGLIGPAFVFNAVLTPTQRTGLWNAGAGVGYPFTGVP